MERFVAEVKNGMSLTIRRYMLKVNNENTRARYKKVRKSFNNETSKEYRVKSNEKALKVKSNEYKITSNRYVIANNK